VKEKREREREREIGSISTSKKHKPFYVENIKRTRNEEERREKQNNWEISPETQIEEIMNEWGEALETKAQKRGHRFMCVCIYICIYITLDFALLDSDGYSARIWLDT
jgi:hypothetical protein